MAVGVSVGGWAGIRWCGGQAGHWMAVAVAVGVRAGVSVEEGESVGSRTVVAVEVSGSNAASVGGI